MKQLNHAHIDISHNKGYWFKIQMEFLWPISAKMELIPEDGWGLTGWSGYDTMMAEFSSNKYVYAHIHIWDCHLWHHISWASLITP